MMIKRFDDFNFINESLEIDEKEIDEIKRFFDAIKQTGDWKTDCDADEFIETVDMLKGNGGHNNAYIVLYCNVCDDLELEFEYDGHIWHIVDDINKNYIEEDVYDESTDEYNFIQLLYATLQDAREYHD